MYYKLGKILKTVRWHQDHITMHDKSHQPHVVDNCSNNNSL